MLDLVQLYLRAGDGGNGRVAFFRNRHTLKGGPEGGDGGNGGEIIFTVDPNLNTLQNFSGIKKIVAGNGQLGGRSRQIGKKGTSENWRVPLGTRIWLVAENQASWCRREQVGLTKQLARDQVEIETYQVEKETQSPPARAPDEINSSWRGNFNHYLTHQVATADGQYLPLEEGTVLEIANFDRPDMSLVVCQGGFGGRGNDAFKSSRQTTPMMAEYGTFGEQKMVFLELRLLAQVALVGLPNVGKSTLLSRLTKAQPKIANYPFTTLEPNLGVMTLAPDRSLVIADIPGLVEDANLGKGLGHNFLRHISNCRELVLVLSLTDTEVYDESRSLTEKATILWEQQQLLMKELTAYRADLVAKPILTVVNRSDLYSAALQAAITQVFLDHQQQILFTSGATGENLSTLKNEIWALQF